MVLNLGILINLIYIIYILGFTFRIGIGSGWSSISIQNATMFLMIFFVMRVFMAYYTRKNETENRSSLDKINNEISSFNLSKFKNITDYENKEIKGYKLFFTNRIKNKINSDLKKIMSTGNLSMGFYVDRLENKFKQLHKSKYTIACNSGGGALEIIFRALDLVGQEVLVPTNTFIATYNAVKFSGGIPKLIDTGPDNLNITLETIKKRVTKKTKCIVIVHVGAIISEEIVKIAKFCKSKKIFLVEDCAHASLTKLGNKYAGNFGIAGAFSFYSTKSITSGEGGM